MSARPVITIALIASPGTQTARSRRLASSRLTVVLPDAGTPEMTKRGTARSCHQAAPYHGRVRAIDFHVHLPTPDWLDGSMAGYVEAAEAYFRSRVERQSLDQLAAKYRALDATAVLLAWDAETATGRPRVPNATVADAVRAHPDAFAGIGSVDPHKESAVDEVEIGRAHV